jgi:serine/threonine protein kinase
VIDCRSDIFSLGVMLYQMVTGQHPFAGNSAEEVRQNVWEGTPVEPAELNPAVLPALSTALSRMLAPAPEDRYQTPAELAACLNAIRAVPLPDAGAQKRATVEGGIVAHRPSPPGRRGRRLSGIRAIVAWGLVLLAAATAIVTLALRLRGR